jgi:hypothetical protein
MTIGMVSGFTVGERGALPGVRVRIEDLSAVPADQRLLRSAERRQLRALRAAPRRQEEWIRGRVAIRRALAARLGPRGSSCQVLTRSDGSPAVVGAAYRVALSHDGPWFAVALAPGRTARIGVDLCRRMHAERLGTILARVTGRGVQLDPVVQWAVLECVIKMRGLGITALVGSDAALRRESHRVRVEGIGPSTSVHVMERPEFVVAWGVENWG